MRRKPYTEIGVRRLKCVRCKRRRAEFQWNACADGQFRPICVNCDVELNAVVLHFMRIRGALAKVRRYALKRGMTAVRVWVEDAPAFEAISVIDGEKLT